MAAAVIVTTLKLPEHVHYLIGIASSARRQTSAAWMLASIEDSIQRQAKSDTVLAAALRTKTPPKSRPQQQQQQAAE
jgi:hypothetical protein